ncbi:MAG: hypothetical protein WC881_03470 [Elusimicrobiota bacterium]|jgi:hypothetical protein
MNGQLRAWLEKSKILGGAIVLGPAGLFVAVLMRPETVAAAWGVLLGGLAAGLVAARFRRSQAIVGVILLIAAAVIMPKCLWMLRLQRCGMAELAIARERVENFKQAQGRPPASLEELGALPPLHIWTIDEQDRDHFHPVTTRITILGPGAPAPDDGGWAYDPAQGRVAIACSGFEPKGRHTRLHEL